MGDKYEATFYGQPTTCEGQWHVAGAGRKFCDCGERRNPSFRNLFQRLRDRRQFKRINRS